MAKNFNVYCSEYFSKNLYKYGNIIQENKNTNLKLVIDNLIKILVLKQNLII